MSGVRNPNNIVQKPLPRYSENDWAKAYTDLSNSATHERQESSHLRHKGRYLKNELDTQARWLNRDNTTRLAVRAGEIFGWKAELETCLQNLDTEINTLTKCKEMLDDAWEAKALGLDVGRECLAVRDSREGIDLTDDAVEIQLRNEIDVIERIKSETQDMVDAVFDQVGRLQECRQEVISDLKDKNMALEVDEEQRDLEYRTTSLSLKPDPTRIPRGTVTPEEWETQVSMHRDHCNEELLMSQNLRTKVDQFIKQSDQDLQTEHNATDFEFRKILHATEKAKKELEWQKKTAEEEMADIEKDIQQLEESEEAKGPLLKLAHTRLENRTIRPNKELVRDQPQDGLILEVKQLEHAINELKEQEAAERGQLNKLQDKHKELEREIQRKKITLKLNQQCCDMRARLWEGSGPDTTRHISMDIDETTMDNTGKNLLLTGIKNRLKQKPHQLYSMDKVDRMFTSGRQKSRDLTRPHSQINKRQVDLA